MKYWLIRLEERIGERTNIKSKVAELGDNEDIKQWVETYLKDFYGSNTRKHDGVFWSPDEECCIKISSATQITEEEYRVLNKFLN